MPFAKQESFPILQGMIPRQVRSLLLERLAAGPAVALVGPRQCGKTTLAQSLTASPGAADMDRLGKTADMIGASRRFLVSQTGKVIGDGDRVSCNLPWLLTHIQR